MLYSIYFKSNSIFIGRILAWKHNDCNTQNSQHPAANQQKSSLQELLHTVPQHSVRKNSEETKESKVQKR